MKKNRPINNTIQTRQATAAEEQSYLQIAETTSTEPEEQTATILPATNSRESIPDSEEQITPPETSAEENNSTTTPGTPADEPLDTSAENNITEEKSSEEENSENNIMATGFSFPKFNGSESTVIWLSKLDAWQQFHNYADQKILAMLPCVFEGSASTWFQTLQPPCNSLTAFKKQLTDRFQPILYGMPLKGIRQDKSETMDQYLERAEKISMIHDMAELYKVQAIASGLSPPWRGKVLSREAKSFH